VWAVVIGEAAEPRWTGAADPRLAALRSAYQIVIEGGT